MNVVTLTMNSGESFVESSKDYTHVLVERSLWEQTHKRALGEFDKHLDQTTEFIKRGIEIDRLNREIAKLEAK
jgi:hypothetical protein